MTTENRRRQVDPKETFRYTTPDVQVTARPVDTFVRARLNRVEEPSNAAYLAPVTPLNRPGVMAPARANAPNKPISMLNAHRDFVEPDPTAAITGWLSSAIPQIGGMANDYFDKSGKEQATEAYIETSKRIADGESPEKVMQDMRPETMLGYAERAYDSQMGTVMYQDFERTVEDFVKKNPTMSVEELRRNVNDMFRDYGAGQSIHFKEQFIPKAAGLMGRVESYQSDTLRKQAGEDYLDKVYTATLSKIMDIKQSVPEEQSNKAIRYYVTQVQNEAKMFGVDRDKVTKAVIGALGAELDANSTHYRSPDDLFGWLKEKDVQGGFSIYDNAKYKSMITDYEDRYTTNLHKIEVEERQHDTDTKRTFIESTETELMEAIRKGQNIDKSSFLQKVAGGTNDYSVYKHFESALEDIQGGGWKSDPDKLFALKQPFLNGNEDSAPSIDTIMKAFDDRQISSADRDTLLSWRTRSAEPVYSAGIKQLTARYREPGNTEGYISPRQELAVEHFNTLMDAERQASGGIPDPKRISELVAETHKYVDSIPDKFYKTPSDFMQSRTPQQLLERDVNRGFDEYRQSFKGASKQEYVHQLTEYVGKLEVQQAPLWKAVKRVESGGNPEAVSKKGAVGTMQTMPKTLNDPGFKVRPADPMIMASGNKEAIAFERERVGKDYLSAMQDHYKDTATALIAYNWGPGNTDEWLKSGADLKKLPPETKQYIIDVMNVYAGKMPSSATDTHKVVDSKPWYEKDIDLGTLTGKPIGNIAGSTADFMFDSPTDERVNLERTATEQAEDFLGQESIAERVARLWGEEMGIEYEDKHTFRKKRRL